jgi:hypothetical protein
MACYGDSFTFTFFIFIYIYVCVCVFWNYESCTIYVLNYHREYMSKAKNHYVYCNNSLDVVFRTLAWEAMVL